MPKPTARTAKTKRPAKTTARTRPAAKKAGATKTRAAKPAAAKPRAAPARRAKPAPTAAEVQPAPEQQPAVAAAPLEPVAATPPPRGKWNNQEVAALLYRIGTILELQGEVVFKVIAYRRAADAIEHLSRNLADIWQGNPENLRTINGVGEALALKIDELFRTGRLNYYDKIARDIPPGLFDLLTIPGIGPKTVMRLWKDLNITDINALEAGVRAGRLRDLSGFGAKSEDKILAGIENARRKKSNTRVLLGRALPFAVEIIADMRAACGRAIREIEFAGSLRRMKPTIGDIDIVVASNEPEKVIDAFVHLPHVQSINGQGTTKASIIAGNGMQVDLRVLEPASWGTALQYFTGSKEHSVELRQVALSQGLSLSEWSYKDVKTGAEIRLAREDEVYEKLGLDWIPPELREATGEIHAAQQHTLPDLIVLSDLKGDFQSHSTWSDGSTTIAQMAEAARARGLHYFTITDHSNGLGVARGLDYERARLEWAEIDELNRHWTDFKVLKGIEVEIRADGSIDLPDDVLAQFDVVVGSTHSALGQPREQITERVLRAMRNPYVDILAHPTGRLIGTRDPSALDLEEVFRVALETGTILEMNAAPERLDLSDVHARRAHELGIPLVISSDAHSPEGLDVLYFGVGMARRAWLQAKDVVNTLEWEQLRPLLKRNRRGK